MEALPEGLAGRYRAVRTLGSGSFGRVVEATQLATGRTVAVKLFEPRGIVGEYREQAKARFGREVLAMQGIASDRVVRVLEGGLDQDPPWLAMEFVEGESLEARLARGRLPWREVVELGRQLCTGLAALHAAGVLHRDLKPANVMLRASGGAVIADLGLAALAGATVLTRTGQVLGTPKYLPPEVLAGAPWSPAGDVYQAALVLFEAATGRRGYQAASFDQLLRQVARGERAGWPAGIEVPPGLRAVIDRATAADPVRRTQSAVALEGELERLEGEGKAGVAGATATVEGIAATDEASGRMQAGTASVLEGPVATGSRGTARPGAGGPGSRGGVGDRVPSGLLGLGLALVALGALGGGMARRIGEREAGPAGGSGKSTGSEPAPPRVRPVVGRRLRVDSQDPIWVRPETPGAVPHWFEAGGGDLELPAGRLPPGIEWRNGERRGRIPLDREACLAQVLRRATEELGETARPLGASWLAWAPDLFTADPDGGPEEAVAASLWEAWQAAEVGRTLAREEAGAPSGVGAGSAEGPGPWEPGWRGEGPGLSLGSTSRIDLAFTVEGGTRSDRGVFGFELTSARGAMVLSSEVHGRAAQGVRFRWPEESFGSGPAMLLVEGARVPVGTAWRVRPADREGPGFLLFRPDPRAERSRSEPGRSVELGLVLPGRLLPRPGEGMRLELVEIAAGEPRVGRLRRIALVRRDPVPGSP